MFTPLASFPKVSDTEKRRNAAAAILPRIRLEIQCSLITCWRDEGMHTRRGGAEGTYLPRDESRTGRFRWDSRRQRVRAACLELLNQGSYPTSRWLVEQFPGIKASSLRSYRDSLLHEIRKPSGMPTGPALEGNTPEERAEIEARIARVRAEKIARGEVPGWAFVAWRVPRSRDLRFEDWPREYFDDAGDAFELATEYLGGE